MLKETIFVTFVFVCAFAYWFMAKQKHKAIYHMPHNLTDQEERIVIRQHGVILLAFLAFVMPVFFNVQAQFLLPVGTMGLFYTGISSVKNRVSVVRFRGQYQPATGALAVGFGLALVTIALIITYITVAPLLQSPILVTAS